MKKQSRRILSRVVPEIAVLAALGACSAETSSGFDQDAGSRGRLDGGSVDVTGRPTRPGRHDAGATHPMDAGSGARDGATSNTADAAGADQDSGTIDSDSGAGQGSDAGATPSGPALRIADATSVTEGDVGTVAVSFDVTLSAAASSAVSVDWTTRDGTAKAYGLPPGYQYATGTVVFAAGETTQSVQVQVTGDTYIESTETFYVDLSNPQGAAIARATATATILDDDKPWIALGPQPLLNDTGDLKCSDDVGHVGVACPLSGYPGQDAQFGRDVNPPAKTGGGNAAFDFTKLDASGQPLANQSVTYASTPWSCVRDNVTGLVWEIKSTSAGLHSNACTFGWWDGHSTVNAGGPREVVSTCGNIRNDTYSLLKAINVEAYCGFSDWRMPTVEELRSIADYQDDPAIDPNYFPNTPNSYFWTGELHGTQPWGMAGMQTLYSINYENYVRVVRGGTPASGTRFVDNGDGTLTDNRTKLMWKRCTEGQTWDTNKKTCTGSASFYYTFKNALAQAAASNAASGFANHTDWRLPNIKELGSLVDHTQSFSSGGISVSIDPSKFGLPAANAQWGYWSSTSTLSTLSQGPLFGIDMIAGYEMNTGLQYVLLVRDAP